MAVTNNGQSTQSVMLIDPSVPEVIHETKIRKSWYGLAFSADETRLYASGGNDNQILVYDIRDRQLMLADSIVLGTPWPTKISPTGVTVGEGSLFVTTKEDSALYIVSLADKSFRKLNLGHEAYASVLSPDKSVLYVSLWGGSTVAVVDTKVPTVRSTIQVGSNPNELILSRDGKRLFVAQGNDNGVSVISTETLEVMEVLQAALYPASPAGSTPNALSLSADEQRLYIANADNNALAVFDVSEPGEGKSLGFIPTDWYPTSVKVHQGKLFVANGKGGRSMANPKGPNPYEQRSEETQYIAGLFKGTLMVMDEPSVDELEVYAKAVYSNSPFNPTVAVMPTGMPDNPIPGKIGDKTPIKYVFYIVRENRTYDQVLGDMPKGNGDSSLCLFPARVTPNAHALADQFVLLDNFYVNAEVSADGHNWSMAAYANDYTEKTWPTSYGSRGGTYDYEGSRKIAQPRDGFIWDYCQRAGVSYRSYGEFVYNGKANLKSLEGHFDPDFPHYDLRVPDMVRFEKWKVDFDSLLARDAVPQLSTIRLPNDHTAGARVGMPTPRAMVAENDLALGQMVEYISQSKIWNQSVIFVLEDDAQNGPDHVDAHRSVALVVSPYVKRGAVVSEMYTTTSMLRTMELILGLPPMSQYDAGAKPMWSCFTSKADNRPFRGLPATYDLKELNKEVNKLSLLSDSFNLEVMDAAPDNLFSEVIWKTIRGAESSMPPPVRSAFIIPAADDDDD